MGGWRGILPLFDMWVPFTYSYEGEACRSTPVLREERQAQPPQDCRTVTVFEEVRVVEASECYDR